MLGTDLPVGWMPWNQQKEGDVSRPGSHTGGDVLVTSISGINNTAFVVAF